MDGSLVPSVSLNVVAEIQSSRIRGWARERLRRGLVSAELVSAARFTFSSLKQ